MNQTTFIDVDNLKLLKRYYLTNPMIGACCNVLNHYLLPERKITFLKKKKELKLTDSERDEWDVFAMEMFTQILCWGFVIFTDDLKTVSLDDIDSIQLNTATKELLVTLSEQSKQHYSNVLIMNSFGLCPLNDGTIVSCVARVKPAIDFVQKIMNQAVAIEVQKLNPEVVCEATESTDLTNQRGHKIESRHVMEYNSGTKTAQEVREELHDAQNTLYDLQDRADLDNRKPSYHGEKTKLAYTALPPGTKVGTVITSDGRSDLVSIIRMVDQKICAVLGVPRSMLINDSVARADTQATHDCFRIALKRYRKDVKHVLVVAALIKFGKSNITIKLPESFHGATEELTKMYLLGMITYIEYSQLFCSRFNTTPATLEDPLSQEQKSELAIQCMQSMVTQHHGRT